MAAKKIKAEPKKSLEELLDGLHPLLREAFERVWANVAASFLQEAPPGSGEIVAIVMGGMRTTYASAVLVGYQIGIQATLEQTLSMLEAYQVDRERQVRAAGVRLTELSEDLDEEVRVREDAEGGKPS